MDELNGHPLPSEQGLSARLIRNFGVKDYAALKGSQIFLTNLRENGLVTDNNIVRLESVFRQVDIKPDAALIASIATASLQNNFIQKDSTTYIEIPVPLKGGKKAFIRIPEDYTTEDCERIGKFIEALK